MTGSSQRFCRRHNVDHLRSATQLTPGITIALCPFASALTPSRVRVASTLYGPVCSHSPTPSYLCRQDITRRAIFYFGPTTCQAVFRPL